MSRPSPFPERLAAASLFLLLFWLVHHWFWRHGQLVDWPVYEAYGRAIVDRGAVPYRDFAVEYPPGALPVFVAPTVSPDYASAFAWLMDCCGVLLVVAAGSVSRFAAWFTALAPALVGSLILSRFDLWPALLLVSALALLIVDRHRLGWAFLGAAVAAKLWPLVVVPPALVWSARRGRLADATVGAAVVAVCFLPFVVLSPAGVWSSVHGQLSRPLQLESLASALLTTFGRPEVITSHGSQNVSGHDVAGVAMSAVQVATLVALWVLFARGPATRARLLRYAAASACAFTALGKVLSPQYLLWLIPLVPLVRGVRGLVAAGLLTAACVLTQVWFPERYWDYVSRFSLAPVVLARDLVLVALLVVLAWPERVRERLSAPPRTA